MIFRKGPTSILVLDVGPFFWNSWNRVGPNQYIVFKRYSLIDQKCLKKLCGIKDDDELRIAFNQLAEEFLNGDEINRNTGEIREAELFVGVLGASNYTFAEASWTQSLPYWINSHVRAFEYFGGVSKIVVPGNLKTGVTKS